VQTEPAPVDGDTPLEVSPEELVSSAIPIAKRGYEPDVIDALLERAASTIARLHALDGPELERQRRGQAEVLQRTLMMAQSTADRTVADAQAHARALVEDAERRAQQLMADAEQLATHLVESEASRAQLAVGEALTRRTALEDDVRALEQFLATARSRIRDALDTQTTTLEQLLGQAMIDPPARHVIDLTDPFLDAGPRAPGPPPGRDVNTPIEARLV
jgi:cell division septum initiation protein DivIVA